MIQKLTLFVFLLLPLLSNAQRSPFDNSGVLIVQVVDADTGKALTDHTPVLEPMAQHYKSGSSLGELARFMGFENTAENGYRTPFHLNPESQPEGADMNLPFDEIHFQNLGSVFVLFVSLDLKDEHLQIGLYNEDGSWVAPPTIVEEKHYFDVYENMYGHWENVFENGYIGNYGNLRMVTIKLSKEGW